MCCDRCRRIRRAIENILSEESERYSKIISIVVNEYGIDVSVQTYPYTEHIDITFNFTSGERKFECPTNHTGSV